MGDKNLRVEDAAKLLGLKPSAVYKAVDACTIPAVKDIVGGKTEVSIPANVFMVCIQRKKEKAQKKLDHLQNSEQILRRILNGER